MSIAISIDSPLAASALEVANRMYSDIHPAPALHIDPGSDHSQKMMETRVRAVVAMTVMLLTGISQAIPGEWQQNVGVPPTAGQMP